MEGMTRTALDGRQLAVTDLDLTSALLERWAVAHYGPGSVVREVEPMPGHAGISFGFAVVAPTIGSGGGGSERLVLRVAPPGVRRVGPADVLHQVPVLRAARLSGVPVPAVRWWSDDERWFGSPYFAVERLPGGSLNCWEPQSPDPSAVTAVFEQAIGALAQIHRIDWRRRLPGWATPRPLIEEVEAWAPILFKGRNDAWTRRALTLRDALVRTVPPQQGHSVVHGDFYSNNWVSDSAVLSGVVDWEIATVGPPLLDLAWLMMIYDPQCWGITRRAWMTWSPDPGDLAEAYARVSGRDLTDLAWYRGLAAWRFAAITALNVRLHREGRRPDATWELMADAFSPLVSSGLAHAAEAAGRP